MFLIGCTKKYLVLGEAVKILLETEKKKVILVEIKLERDGESNDIFELIEDNHYYSQEEIKKFLNKLVVIGLLEILKTAQIQLPN